MKKRADITVSREPEAPNYAHGFDRVAAGAFISSAPRQWDGLLLEAGCRRPVHFEEVMVNGHLLMMNLADIDLCFKMRVDGDWTPVRLAPMEFLINPEGGFLSVREMPDSRYASCSIDGRYLDSLAGCHFEIDPATSVKDTVLAKLVQVLIAILEDVAHYSQPIALEVVRTFVNATATRHGHPAAELKIKGGIAPSQMKLLNGWLKEHLHDPLSVGLMAAEVGLSAAHFSREFKRSTGLTPWEYVVRLRLDHAKESLLSGNVSTTVASQFGFADQSHLSRLFKARFGVTPAAFVKANNRQG